MRIGAIARQSGLATSAIRFYEAEGLLPAASRRANGSRDYPASMIETLHFIDSAQALGFTLKEIKIALAARIDGGVAADLLLPALERKLAAILAGKARPREEGARAPVSRARDTALLMPRSPEPIASRIRHAA